MRSSTIASRAPASTKGASASTAATPLSAGSGESSRPAAQVEAEHERRIRQLGPEPPERLRAGQRLGADHDPRDTQLEEPRDRRGAVAVPASTITRASRASAATTSGCGGPPPIASRSAT